jgi:IS30 family transposase
LENLLANPNQADQSAWDRDDVQSHVNCWQRTGGCLNVVASTLQLQWSPEQIAGWLKRKYAGDDLISGYQLQG